MAKWPNVSVRTKGTKLVLKKESCEWLSRSGGIVLYADDLNFKSPLHPCMLCAWQSTGLTFIDVTSPIIHNPFVKAVDRFRVS